MTRRLLAFSRRQVLAPRVVEINDVVMNLRSMLARLIEANVSLDFSLTPADTSVRIDPTQIEQILVNLVVNARDALPEGGRIVVGTSTASADSEAVRRLAELGDADHVVLVVSDTGTGIPPEVRERIFEPFFTTKEAGRGTGLGLSTVYGIVRQSQGTIDLESAPGEGTSFAIYLPQVRGDGSDDRDEPARAPVNVSGLRVLLVDDDTALRRFSERALTELGCVTGAADSVADGRRLVEAAPQPFDVALIDVMMPDAGGPALGAWLNAHRPSTRVIYTSGYPSESVASAGLPLGSAFLQKPFTKATLLATLSEARGGGR
jgi:CheY-like chemotaxis protein